MHFDLVVATDAKLGIGKNQTLPWKLPGDMAFFKNLTTSTTGSGQRNAVIMGRKTWESIPVKFRPLPGRLNIVLSRAGSLNLPDGVVAAGDLSQALAAAETAGVERCFVIGGGAVYAESLKHPSLSKLYITEIQESFDCDTFFPPYQDRFVEVEQSPVKNDNGVNYSFKVYAKKP